MPGRLDFETEFDNDADQHVGAMDFFETDSPEEMLLKTTMLSIYNATLTERIERKNFVFSRNLIDFR
jgi:transcriptional adapter 2-alpha